MWLILRTEPCREKVAEFFLKELHSFDTYLPMLAVARVARGKVIASIRPLFPSYLFSRYDGGSFRRYKSTPGVATVVMAASSPAFIPQSAIDSIDARLAEFNASPELFEPGQVVLTPQGLEATFVSRRGHIRAQVMLSLFSRKVVADVRMDKIK